MWYKMQTSCIINSKESGNTKKLSNGMSMQTICETYKIGTSTVYDVKTQKEKLLKFFSDSGSMKQMFLNKSVTWKKFRIGPSSHNLV